MEPKFNVAHITHPKKYKAVAKSNIKPNKVRVDPMRNRTKIFQEFV